MHDEDQDEREEQCPACGSTNVRRHVSEARTLDIAGVAAGAALVVRVARRGRSRPARAAGAVSSDLRLGLLSPGVWPKVLLASLLVVVGHTATFVIAARVAGSTAALGELVALLMVVQVAVVIPLAVGGWGLREGAAAWAFGAAGLGAATGVTVTTLYAVLMLIAVAPGAGLLLADALGHRRGRGRPGRSRRPDRRGTLWRPFVANTPDPVTDLGAPLPAPLDVVRGVTVRPVTAAVEAVAVFRRMRIPQRLGDVDSTSATGLWSPSKPGADVLERSLGTLCRDLIDTRSAR